MNHRARIRRCEKLSTRKVLNSLRACRVSLYHGRVEVLSWLLIGCLAGNSLAGELHRTFHIISSQDPRFQFVKQGRPLEQKQKGSGVAYCLIHRYVDKSSGGPPPLRFWPRIIFYWSAICTIRPCGQLKNMQLYRVLSLAQYRHPTSRPVNVEAWSISSSWMVRSHCGASVLSRLRL